MPETPVEKASRELRHLDAVRSDALAHLKDEVQAGWKLGVPIAELARQADVGRQTIYSWLVDVRDRSS